MRSYTHIAGALVLFLVFAYLFDLNQIFVGLMFAALGSVFPDILDNLIGKHRGYGHSVLWIILAVPILFFNFTIGSAIIIGLISHILLDSITTHEVPLLYPIRKTNFIVLKSNRRVKTGTNQDKAVFLALIFILITILCLNLAFTQINTINPFQAITAQNSPTDRNMAINASNELKTNFDFDLHLNQNDKNITVKKISENETNYLIKNIEPGG
ncbi:MAG: metal-dependent hydrolase [Methanobacterium sp. ERen5]|nr:MAG: metal-dependent hydrolase [Methanobacterium sp. ERen5]